MARITAFGGIFIHSADSQALGAWYRDTLGLTIEDWGGAIIRAEGAGPAYGVWAPFNKDTGHFKPSSREFMINFAVDDLDGFIAGLEAKGIEVKDRQEMDGMGKFAWVVPGEAARMAQPWAGGMRRFLARRGIRGIVNLRGRNDDLSWWRKETAAAQALG